MEGISQTAADAQPTLLSLIPPKPSFSANSPPNMPSSPSSGRAPDPAAPATLYSAASFSATPTPAAGYSVYLHTSEHKIQLSQPLSSPHQTLRHAAIRGLHTALQLARTLCLRNVQIAVDSPNLVAAFSPSSRMAISNIPPALASSPPSLTRRVTAPVSGNAPSGVLWRETLAMADALVGHGANVRVVHIPDAAGIVFARRLAKQALRKHARCSTCGKCFGPAGQQHACVGGHAQNGDASPMQGQIQEHTDTQGNTIVAEAVCPKCNRSFGSLTDLEKHIETSCPDVLQAWFAHTQIVKK